MRRGMVFGVLFLIVAMLCAYAPRTTAQPQENTAAPADAVASAETASAETAVAQTPAAADPPAEEDLDLPALREAWRRMTAADFVKSATETLKEHADHPEVAPAVAEDSAQRIIASDEARDADYEVVYQMLVWSRPHLDDEKRGQIRGKLLQRTDNNGELTFPAIRDKFALLVETGAPRNDAITAAIEWINAQDLEQLPVEQAEWGAMQLSYTPAAAHHYFTVRWTGSIRAPKPGVYTFSGSALRIRGRSGAATVDSAMRMWIDGKLMFDTTSPNPPEAIPFAADQARLVKIEFEHKHTNSWIRLQRPAAAMLYWQGPNLERQIVPAEALTTPNPDGDDKPGLLGVYEYRPRGLKPPVTAERIDPNIDFFWTGGYTLENPEHPQAKELFGRLARRVAAQYASPEYLQERAEGLAKGIHPFPNGAWMAELMTSEERQAALKAISEHEPLLKHLTHFLARDMYWMFRGGAEEESIHFLGHWMQTREWWWARVHTKFFMHNRKPYFDIADSIAYEYPAGRDVLEKQYLVKPDGSCSLGAAYTLAYAYTFRNKSQDWTNIVNSHLHRDIPGNARVTWLLARAQVNEIRGHWTYRYRMLPERWDAGEYFLNAAIAAAEDEPTRLQAYGEKIARLLATDRAEAARRLVAQARPHVPSPESQAVLAYWRRSATEFTARFAAQREQQHLNAQSAYVVELERRRQKAEESENPAEAERYERLIEAAQRVNENSKSE